MVRTVRASVSVAKGGTLNLNLNPVPGSCVALEGIKRKSKITITITITITIMGLRPEAALGCLVYAAKETHTVALVEVRNVVKQFQQGDTVITPLAGVDLDVEQGQFIALTGASGTGKSTLLNLVAGIDRPASGSIRVADTEIAQMSRTRLAAWRARHVGYVFQMHNLIQVLSAAENIELPLLLLPLSRSQRRERVQIALDAVGLADRADHLPRQLSGGQEQRVGIARAIVADPTIVVADEPTGDLDDETSDQIVSLLKQLNKQLGTTILMVTHDTHVASAAGRRFLLEKGKLTELRGADKALSGTGGYSK